MLKKRVLWGDLIRIIAMIMVVFLHALAPYRYSFFDNHNTFQYLFVGWLDAITRSAVPIFFMLTGYFVLPKRVTLYKNFIKRTTKKLIIPFISFSLVIYLFFHIIDGQSLSISNFLSLLLKSPGVQYQMWFMYIIIILYLFIPILNKFVVSLTEVDLKRLIGLIFIIGNLFYTINVVSSASSRTLFSNIYLPDIIIYANYLFIGYYLNRYSLSTKTKHLLYFMGLLSIITLPICSFIYNDYMDTDKLTSGISVFSFFIGTSIFILLKDIFSKFNISKNNINVVGFISRLSFYVYMIHPTIIELIRRNIYNFYAPASLIAQLGDVVLQFIISITASFIIAAFYYYTEIFLSRLLTHARQYLCYKNDRLQVTTTAISSGIDDA